MDRTGPSRTALITGYARAYHQTADTPRIFTDPLAAPLLGGHEFVEAGDALDTVVRDRARRLFFAARSRFAEDAIAAAVGTRQVVTLGAGLDTFGCRNTNPDLQVYEVDHPATQAWKRGRLTAAGIPAPSTLTFVPVDFETQGLATELAAAGFTRTEPAIFIWLGVIFYLTSDAARATLDYIAGQARPVEVVFDYLQQADTGEDRAHLRARAQRLARAGEPLVSYHSPDTLAGQLHALGFAGVEDRAADRVIGAYLGESLQLSADEARTLRASRLVRARSL
ncbi:class I SAM-dependent methyltransferase [Mycolicibacterium phlei]|jgi:methyltransferase (TIGR00027 family)